MASLLIVFACFSWTLLSFQFHHGEGHAERPILLFIFLYACAWCGFLLGYLQLRRSDRKSPLFLILLVAFVARILLLPSSLIQENDVYRYVLDGQVLLAGQNPYRYPPLILPEKVSEPLRKNLENPQAREILSRVGYPYISTVYPPLAQLSFAIGVYWTQWSWIGLRLLYTFVDFALIGLLVVLLVHMGSSPAWVLLYAWNPLILKEVINSVHLDVLAAFFIVLMMVSFQRYKIHLSWGWLFSAMGAMSGAVLSKIYPILLFPAAVLLVFRYSGRKPAVIFATISLVGTLLSFLPFSSVGISGLSSGLIIYGERWQMNEGMYALVESVFSHPRLLCAILIAVVATLLPWIFLKHRGSLSQFVMASQWVFLIWFLLLPSPFPWYAVTMVALLAVAPRTRGIAPAMVVLSGVSGLYYLSFYFEYHNLSEIWWVLTRLTEHGLIWGTLGFSWYLARRRFFHRLPRVEV